MSDDRKRWALAEYGSGRTSAASGGLAGNDRPDELAQWWGPQGFTAPRVDFEPRVGASFRIAMQPPQGELFHLLGDFREVDPSARLCYTFVWDPPDPGPRDGRDTHAS